MRALVLLASTALIAAGVAQAEDASSVLASNRAATGGGAFAGKGAMEVRYAYAGQGMTGTVGSTYDVATGAFLDTADIGPTTGGGGFDGRQAWMKDMSGAITPQAGGDTRQLAVNEAYRDANLWWRADRGGATIASLGVKIDGGARYDVLSVTPKGGKAFEAWFDAVSHLLARTVEPQSAQIFTTFFSDYRPVDGALIAGKEVVDDGTGVQYRQTQMFGAARFLPARPLADYAAPRWTPSDARIDNPSGRTTVPFQLLNNHIYAKVQINGKGPFLCIFDTGGHDLLTPDTAKLLAVKSEGQSPGQGAGVNVVDTAFARGVSFQVGDLTIDNQTIAVLPFEAPQVEGFSEQGMIGFEVFRRFVTQIDYDKRTLTFIDPARFDPKDAGTPIPFVFYNHLPQVEGAFEGIPGAFDIDTGSRSELDITRPTVEANGLMARHSKGVAAVDGWGVGGPSRSYITRGSELTLGPIKTSGVVAGFSTDAKGAFADPNYEGNVGSKFLKQFVVTFDYGRQIMYLKRLPKPDPDVGTFDRAGMWINTAPAGFKIVDLTAGGAARSAGLKVGDEITSVDGAPASSIAISDLRQKLREEPAGTKVSLTVQSAAATRPVTLTLKDQI
ncbi:MAG: aspartyl protease family protein [Pseudomonadota bacterium]|nr:aspartyl protease family protein [Pseudomonadota bacterium]